MRHNTRMYSTIALYCCSTIFKGIDSSQDCCSILELTGQGITVTEHCDVHGQAVDVPYNGVDFAVLLR